MTSVELKQQLISKIQITDDKDILEGILELLEFELNNKDTFKLTDEQKKSIALSKQQIMDGKVYTEEEGDQLMEQWLKE